MTELSLKIDKTIHAPIEKVFDAWLDPQLMSKFMSACSPGHPDSDVENDPREGGKFSIIMHYDNQKLPHTGVYLEIKRPNKLVFTWKSHVSIDDSKVTLNFTKVDDRQTKISLLQVKFIDEEKRAMHEEGWSQILKQLEGVLN
ncbi:MAG: SRPBCC family protein [Desulfobacteraceae bacterium]|nr:SRPBCC family protein [Desulfobacteraceae bacterium]